MNNNKTQVDKIIKEVTWPAAFKILLKGNNEVLGKRYRLKKNTLHFAIGFTVMSLFFRIYLASLYSGAQPPQIPVIKGIGVFSTEFGRTLSGAAANNIVFNTDDGRKYLTDNQVAPPELSTLAKLNPSLKVYVEGFVLQNGKGSFWPTLVTSTNGQIIMDKDKLQSIYNNYKKIVPIKVSLIMLMIAIIFWLMSVYFAYQIKAILLKEE